MKISHNLNSNAIIDIENEIKREKEASKMIKDHNKRDKHLPKYAASVPGSPNRTAFICSTKERAEQKASEYKELHKKYWL